MAPNPTTPPASTNVIFNPPPTDAKPPAPIRNYRKPLKILPKTSTIESYPKDLSPMRKFKSSAKISLDSPNAIEASLQLPTKLTDMQRNTLSRSRSRESSLVRSPSPSSSITSSISRVSSASSLPPRRVFPQTYQDEGKLDIYKMHSLDASPVVFDANLSFVLGCKRQPVRQSFRPSPSHTDPATRSNYLTSKIQNFLNRTDHVMEEWGAMGTKSKYRNDDTVSLIEKQRSDRALSQPRANSLGRSKSVTNILVKGYQLTKSMPRTPRSRSGSMARDMSLTEVEKEDDDDSQSTLLDEVFINNLLYSFCFVVCAISSTFTLKCFTLYFWITFFKTLDSL